MIEFLRKLLWDESAFERYGRGILIALAVALPQAGAGTGEINWISVASALVAGLIGAGEKNAPAK